MEQGAGDSGGVGEVAEVHSNLGEMSQLDNVLSHGLIGEKIASFLSLGDMKIVRQASPAFDRMIRDTQAFKDKAKLLICKETVQLPNFLVDTTFPWRNVEVEMSIPNTVVDIITDILQSVQTLHLKMVRTDNVDNQIIVDFITALLSKTPNLINLKMESSLLERVLHDVFSDTQVQTTLKKIKSFEIATGYRQNDATYYIDGDTGEDGPFPRNFLQLSLLPMKLESFKLGKIATTIEPEYSHLTFIPNILASTDETLVELTLHLQIWKLRDMKSIHCPKLRRLELTAAYEDWEMVKYFLQHQPLLEELVIKLKGKFPTELLSTIEAKSSKLKKLHITAKTFVRSGGGEIDWSFVSRMENLKDFSLHVPFCFNPDSESISLPGTALSLWRNVPENRIKHLQIKGVDRFWYNSETSTMIDDGIEKIGIMNRLKDLTSLKLVRCEDSVDDELLQNIFQNFKNLRTLELSHCPNITNEGITGVNGDGVAIGVSIQSLKALTTLSIRACPEVTHEGMLIAVKFPYLRSLDYLTVTAVSTHFLNMMASQNPSLETIAVFLSNIDLYSSPTAESDIKMNLKKINPRIWQLNDLNFDNWVEQDSDSDASDMHFGDGDSDFSGSGYPGVMGVRHMGVYDYVDFDDDFDEEDDLDDFMDDDDDDI